MNRSHTSRPLPSQHTRWFNYDPEFFIVDDLDPVWRHPTLEDFVFSDDPIAEGWSWST
jgi:hypothetical protein